MTKRTPFSQACEDALFINEPGDLEIVVLDHYDELFDFYLDSGEMPYGVAKARDGDPVTWICEQLEKDYDLS